MSENPGKLPIKTGKVAAPAERALAWRPCGALAAGNMR